MYHNYPIFAIREREKSFQNAGAQFCFSMPFEKIKDMQAEEFLFALLQEFQVQAFVCGDDFRFGKGAVGTPDFIKQATQVCVETLPLVMEDGKKISSSKIKAHVQSGELRALSPRWRTRKTTFGQSKQVYDH